MSLERHDFRWLPDGDGLALYVSGNIKAVAHVIPDGAGWRIEWPDGGKSMPATLERSKALAVSEVIAAANRRPTK